MREVIHLCLEEGILRIATGEVRERLVRENEPTLENTLDICRAWEISNAHIKILKELKMSVVHLVCFRNYWKTVLYLLQISFTFVEENMRANEKPTLFNGRSVMIVGRRVFFLWNVLLTHLSEDIVSWGGWCVSDAFKFGYNSCDAEPLTK